MQNVLPIQYGPFLISIFCDRKSMFCQKKKNCNGTTTRNTPFILMILAREIVVFNVLFLSYENRKIASASTFHFEDKNWHSNFWEVFSGSVIAFWVLWYSKNGLYLSNQIEKTCLRK